MAWQDRMLQHVDHGYPATCARGTIMRRH